MSGIGDAFTRLVRSMRAERERRSANNPLLVGLGTITMLVVAVALLASLVNLWPSVEAATTIPASGAPTPHVGGHGATTVRLFFALVSVKVTSGTALLLLVIVVAALGSMVHAATSFADFVGNRRFYSSWIVWYLLRLVIGVMLALLLYFAVRGGFFSASSEATSVNPFGIAALAGLAGLFSKQATDKLREVFETLFRVSKDGGDEQRKDDLANPIPVVTGVEPSALVIGETGRKLIVSGEHFVDGATVVRINGQEHEVRFVSEHELEVEVAESLLTTPGALSLAAFTGPPGGGESKPPATLTITSALPSTNADEPTAAPGNPPPPGAG